MAVYFISDLHLCAERPETIALFSKFLDNTGNARQLYILGDLFEAWIGDDYHDPALTPVLEKLQHYSESTKTFFIHGNRDFLVGQNFAERFHCTLLEEAELIDISGQPALIMHGDTLCSDDVDYQQFRKKVRAKSWQQSVLAMPVEERLQLARRYRMDSDSGKAMKSADIMDVNQDTVHSVMRTYSVHCLIHGHTHRPAIHQFDLDGKPAIRYVLGDWSDKAKILKVESGQQPELIDISLD